MSLFSNTDYSGDFERRASNLRVLFASETEEDFRRQSRASTVNEGVPFVPSRRSHTSYPNDKAPEYNQQALGLVLVAMASVIFGTAAMFVKLSPLSGLFVMEVRCFVQWVLSVTSIILWRIFNPKAKRTVSDMLFGEPGVRFWILLRSVVHWAFMVSYWLGARLLPFGNCTAVVYVGPLFTAIPAYFFLGEQIEWHFLAIAPMSLAGLILITQPSFLFGHGTEELSPLGLAFALSATISLIVLPVITKCGKDSHWLQIEHGSTFIGAFILTPAAIWLESHLDPSAGGLAAEIAHAQQALAGNWGAIAVLLLIPCAQYVGLAFQTVAYQVAEAGKCSLMLYLMIPQSYVLQNLVFHDPMTTMGNLGMALIVLACLLNGWATVRAMAEPEGGAPLTLPLRKA